MVRDTLNIARIFAITIASVLLLRCAAEPADTTSPETCDPLINNFNNALNTYMLDVNNRANCIAVKEAAGALLDCPGLTATEKAEYKNTIDAIYCN